MVKWLSVANIVLLALSDRFWKPVPTGKAHWERICRKITVGYIYISLIRRTEQLFRNTNIFPSKYRPNYFGILNMVIVH